jgi:hypothetical protein
MALALTYGYALLAATVGLAAVAQPSREIIQEPANHGPPRRIRDLDLVHLWLTSARACVADRFDGENVSEPILTASTDGLFKENKRTRRLGAGFVQSRVYDAGMSSQLKQRNVRRFKIDLVESL